MKHESVEVTVNGLRARVITYSGGWERVVILDRRVVDDREIKQLISYLKCEGFLFWKNPEVELVKLA